ncbi:hypothetical protein [Peribacillus sp. NPDC060253]|uniref:hypothetical protein n=1 Tax=Peribacillus sp. NPDC060253 TaxID=3347084 RepID=UPI0036692DA1
MNTSAWTAGGVYRSTGIADQSIQIEKTDFAKKNILTVNIFDKTKVNTGKLVNYTTGVWAD